MEVWFKFDLSMQGVSLSYHKHVYVNYRIESTVKCPFIVDIQTSSF